MNQKRNQRRAIRCLIQRKEEKRERGMKLEAVEAASLGLRKRAEARVLLSIEFPHDWREAEDQFVTETTRAQSFKKL